MPYDSLTKKKERERKPVQFKMSGKKNPVSWGEEEAERFIRVI